MVAATAISSIVPSQNTGIDTSASDMTSSMLSAARPRYAAAIAPIAIPRINDNAIAAPASNAVAGKRSAISRVTFSRRMYERPRSP